MKPFNNYFRYNIYLDVYLVEKIHSVSIFNGFILLASVNAITCVYKDTFVIIFNLCLLSKQLVTTYACYVG